jgi:predicted phosphohydrolase
MVGVVGNVWIGFGEKTCEDWSEELNIEDVMGFG